MDIVIDKQEFANIVEVASLDNCKITIDYKIEMKPQAIKAITTTKKKVVKPTRTKQLNDQPNNS